MGHRKIAANLGQVQAGAATPTIEDGQGDAGCKTPGPAAGGEQTV